MNNQFELLENIIKSRRSTGWAKMNGQAVPDETMAQILALADWAPTHGRTEPWRFFVYRGEALKNFGKAHADLYWAHTPEDKRQEATREKLEHNVDNASHLVIAVMKRGDKPNIPQVEEIASAAAGIQNVLLGAAALGVSSFWSSGGMTHKHALKEYLGLGDEDMVMGLVFFGYTNEPVAAGTRNVPLTDKVRWMQ